MQVPSLALFSAYELLQRSYRNITIVAENFENLASHQAGGLLAPVSMDNTPEMAPIIDKIGIEAYQFYAAIAQEKHPDFEKSAMMVPTYFGKREDAGLEPYVGKVMQPAKDVILDFGNGTTRKMVAYDDGVFIDVANMMQSLTNYLKPKVKFVKKKVTNFSDIYDQYIINCSGIGAKALNNDHALTPVQGHLIMLEKQNPVDLNYMILVYFNETVTKPNQRVKRSFYIFPKKIPNTSPNDIGVIGGTFIEGATEATPNTKEFKILLNNAKKFYGIR